MTQRLEQEALNVGQFMCTAAGTLVDEAMMRGLSFY